MKLNLDRLLGMIHDWARPGNMGFALVVWRKGHHTEKGEIYVGAHPDDHPVLSQVMACATESIKDQQAGKSSGLILPPSMMN
jgi:hypothetical protein